MEPTYSVSSLEILAQQGQALLPAVVLATFSNINNKTRNGKLSVVNRKQ